MPMLTIIVIIIGILLAIFLILCVYCCCKVSKNEIDYKIMIQRLEELKKEYDNDEKDK